MRKILIIILVTALLLLDYAALDDITGTEPASALWGEWLMLAFSALAFGYLIYKYFKKRG